RCSGIWRTRRGTATGSQPPPARRLSSYQSFKALERSPPVPWSTVSASSRMAVAFGPRRYSRPACAARLNVVRPSPRTSFSSSSSAALRCSGVASSNGLPCSICLPVPLLVVLPRRARMGSEPLVHPRVLALGPHLPDDERDRRRNDEATTESQHEIVVLPEVRSARRR